MPHPLVAQLRFARSEFVRGLDGVSAEDALRRLGPMNCISWSIGHLANQENSYWVYLGQGLHLQPDLRKLVENRLYRERLQKAMGEEVPKQEEQVKYDLLQFQTEAGAND